MQILSGLVITDILTKYAMRSYNIVKTKTTHCVLGLEAHYEK